LRVDDFVEYHCEPKEIEARTRQHDPDRERRERMHQEEALEEALPRCEWLPANQRHRASAGQKLGRTSSADLAGLALGCLLVEGKRPLLLRRGKFGF
jgi:hypothetical protein